MNLQLKGKRALVMAASKGLGFAIANSLAAEGAAVAIVGRDEKSLNLAASALKNAHKTPVFALAADLALPGEAARVTAAAIGAMGGIDILINNIGGPPPSAAVSTDIPAWQKGFEQIFLSVIAATHTALPAMRAQKYGRIVTITSTSVIEPISHLVVSTAMRAAVTGFARTLANEVALDGVTVNTVMPGVIHTDRIESLRRAKADREGTSLTIEMEKTAQSIPAGRLGRPEELADLVAFLASERASYLTGLNIPVDGGARKGV